MTATRRALVERRKAAGYSQEKLAERLRVEPSTIGRWERGETEPQPWYRPRLAKALGVPPGELSRLLLVMEEYGSASTGVQAAEHDHVDRFAWEDDLDQAHALFSRQSFAAAKQLVERWLLRAPDNGSEQTLHLQARSHHLLGNILRDEGILLGLTSATTEYRRAQQLYCTLGYGRRVAQVELLLGVVSEMRFDHARALTVYRTAQNDDRLSPVDKARGLLWQGTVLTKQRKPEQAIPTILAAIEAFERNESATDWEGAHQKLALAYMHAAHFDRAAEAFEIPLASTTNQTPLQHVQLAVARAHLSIAAGDQHTAHRLLDQSDLLAREYDLHHQLVAIQGLRAAAQSNDTLPR
jgi:transcriptional regulator with XRE-family HTH domain